MTRDLTNWSGTYIEELVQCSGGATYLIRGHTLSTQFHSTTSRESEVNKQ
jgi:hypothetical protein